MPSLFWPEVYVYGLPSSTFVNRMHTEFFRLDILAVTYPHLEKACVGVASSFVVWGDMFLMN
jgi:hypothetical protein